METVKRRIAKCGVELIVDATESVEFLAEHLYQIQDRNRASGDGPFASYKHLPDKLKDQWRRMATNLLEVIIDKFKRPRED